MASYTVNVAKHATLAGATVDTITFNAPGGRSVVISNDDTVNKLYVTFGLNGATATTPTVAGDDTFVVRPGTSKQFDNGAAITSVQIIGSGNAYHVEAPAV